MYLPILNTSPQSFCTYLFSTYYTKCTLTFCLHFVFQTYFYVDISYKKVLKGPDAAPFAVCQFNSHYHLEEEEPLWFYDLAYFVILVHRLKFSSSPILAECGGWHTSFMDMIFPLDVLMSSATVMLFLSYCTHV